MSLFSCKDTVRLVSRSLDHTLQLSQWLVMRLHLLLCPPCSRYRRHLLLLRQAARRLEHADLDPESRELPTLSAEARERIKNACEHHDP